MAFNMQSMIEHYLQDTQAVQLRLLQRMHPREEVRLFIHIWSFVIHSEQEISRDY